ncbi:unnamed protein product [Phyllotreta striolata]|uniref:Uncharacterized protein n=1 Tax=Phyllotreta striolata TaxID=444603 RepID=A0A9N9TTE0_PHYSR|nr:unnamed protein product [Phyllotreta striolata]
MPQDCLRTVCCVLGVTVGVPIAMVAGFLYIIAFCCTACSECCDSLACMLLQAAQIPGKSMVCLMSCIQSPCPPAQYCTCPSPYCCK